jgi:hypothetical protein
MVITTGGKEYLPFMLQTTEGSRMYDAISVPLERGTIIMLIFRKATGQMCVLAERCEWRERPRFDTLELRKRTACPLYVQRFTSGNSRLQYCLDI